LPMRCNTKRLGDGESWKTKVGSRGRAREGAYARDPTRYNSDNYAGGGG
jgi:hypothetical protein